MRSIDFMLVTANADLDWSLYASLLRPKGVICLVGVPPSKLDIHAFDLIIGQHAFAGSPIGSPNTIHRMFKFAAQHGIAAVTQTYPFNDVNRAIADLRENKIRYRGVLVAD